MNLTDIIGCQDVPEIHIFVFAQEAKRTRKMVQTLSSAGYVQSDVVNLTIVSDNVTLRDFKPKWTHGALEIATNSLEQLELRKRMDVASYYNALVIILDDHSEPSPLFALWFLIQHCHTNASAIAGGVGKGMDLVSGLALDADIWDGFIAWALESNHSLTSISTASVIEFLVSLPHGSSIVFPSINGGNTFVRAEWQNPAYVEHEPKLTRTWDPVKEPSWGAVEVRLS